MPRLGKAEVRDVKVESKSLPDTETPQDNEELFKQIANDPAVDTADMQVEGDWTYRTIANRITLERRVNNNKINWNSFKKVKWGEYSGLSASNLLNVSSPNQVEASSPSPISINKLAASGTEQPLVNLGEPAAAPSSGFATGDPGLGSPATLNYRMDGRAGSSSAVTLNNQVILAADEGERAVAFSPPGDASFMQMVNQRDWGHQASIAVESLTGMAELGTDSQISVPTFSSSSGPIAFMTPFSYSYPRALGLAILQSSFDIKAGSSTTATVALRNSSGEVLTSANMDLQQGGQSVAVNFLNAPASGIVTVDTKDTAVTINNSEKFPPV